MPLCLVVAWKSLQVDRTISQKEKVHMKWAKARTKWNPPEPTGTHENKLEAMSVSHHLQSHWWKWPEETGALCHRTAHVLRPSYLLSHTMGLPRTAPDSLSVSLAGLQGPAVRAASVLFVIGSLAPSTALNTVITHYFLDEWVQNISTYQVKIKLGRNEAGDSFERRTLLLFYM